MLCKVECASRPAFRRSFSALCSAIFAICSLSRVSDSLGLASVLSIAAMNTVTGLHGVANDVAVLIGIAPGGSGLKKQSCNLDFIEQTDRHQLPQREGGFVEHGIATCPSAGGSAVPAKLRMD